MAPFVYIGTMVTHFFGGSAGREGTAIQMAGSIADQFSKPFKLSVQDRQILIIAAVAGGFGSVFGTPLAGAIFAIEFYFIGRIRYNALFPAFSYCNICRHYHQTLANSSYPLSHSFNTGSFVFKYCLCNTCRNIFLGSVPLLSVK